MTQRDPDLLRLVTPWQFEEAGELARTRIFTLRQRRAASRTSPGKAGTFVYLDTADWVNVIALTPKRQVVLIEQFRHGTAEVTLEIPGGLIDAGEEPLVAGLRELREETGYAGEGGRVIGVVTPNPATQNNRCYTVLVEDAGLRHDPALDSNEEIGVRLLPLERIAELVRGGIIHHALVVAAFYHLLAQG